MKRVLKRVILLTIFLLAILLPTIIAMVPCVSLAQSTVIQVTANGGLNLRTGPGVQYPVIKVLVNGSRWYVNGSSGNWLKLETNQWINGGYTKISSPIKKVTVTASSGLNVRQGPGTNNKIIKVLPSGATVDVLEEKNGWYRIGNIGWIYSYYTIKLDDTKLDNTKLEWYYIPNNTHTVPEVDKKINISKYDGYYVYNPGSKTIFLTFDLGYEAGYTPSILDTLKTYKVKATFFVTKSYIDEHPDLIKQMINEGHLVGNHTKTHPSLPSIATDIKTFNEEILSVANAYKKVTGNEMLKILRPPMGDYSELSLDLTKQLGYKSIFWSFAYYDYDTEKQPDKAYALNKITSSTHDGAIMLLHGVSKTNTEILGEVIQNIKKQGYQFDTLVNLQ
jgi:peptidoglycan-N-acetylmuramic acid deacetylase